MDRDSINAFMMGLKKLTLETGIAINWTEAGIELIGIWKELEGGRYSWICCDGVIEAHDIQWEYEGEVSS